MSSATISTMHTGYRIVPINRSTLRTGLLALCLLVIAAVSATDIWFAVENSSIMKVEQNPICKALIEMDPQGFTWFILGKSAGTVFVLTTLVMLQVRRYRFAGMVTFVVTAFQLGLLTYLTLSDPLTHNLPNFGLLFSDTPECIWRIE